MLADWRRLDEACGLEAVLQRIVDREHYTLDAERRDGALERFRLAGARGGGEEVAADIVGRQALKLDLLPVDLEAAVDAPEAERQRLTHVAEDDIERRQAVEQPAQNEPQRVAAGLCRPAPDRGGKSGIVVEH